jgi:hypothetical protein
MNRDDVHRGSAEKYDAEGQVQRVPERERVLVGVQPRERPGIRRVPSQATSDLWNRSGIGGGPRS